MKVKVLYALTGLITILLIGVSSSALGNAPVVDITQQDSGQETPVEIPKTDTAATSNAPSEITSSSPAVFLPAQPLTDSQRIARLAQQMNNLINMNLPQQITNLQQQLAQVRGQLQEQQHDLQLVNNQLHSVCNDLNPRITQLKNFNSDASKDNFSSQKATGNSLSNNGDIQLQDSTAYQTALSFLTKKQYSKARASFQNYFHDYSNGNYVANAHYWLGEIYLEQKNIKKAALEFQTVKNKFPKSEKVLDAQLKLAIIHAENGQLTQAKQEFMEIKKQNLGSTVSQLASIRLQQLEAANLPSMNP